uniref:Uncharacterized protein n=1 Tax=viral metagenome TaxID=1070528 RepID=A0A6H1ZY56_9ZZZZ
MQLAYQVPMLQIVASNANFLSDPFRVPVGSNISMLYCVTALVGAPAGTIQLWFLNSNGDPVVVASVAVAALVSGRSALSMSPEFIQFSLTQAGGANTLTMSVDFIVQPSNSTPA